MKNKLLLPVTLAVGIGLAVGTWSRLGFAPTSPGIEPPANAQATRTMSDLKSLSAAYADISKRVTPAVVNITARKVIPGRIVRDPFFEFFGGGGPLRREPDRQSQSVGSGVIVNIDGTIITNNHVIEGADAITITLNDKRRFTAKLAGVDPPTDLAVLKIEGKNLPVAQWADSEKLQVGEIVLAIGSPFNLASTVTQGIISAKGRRDLGISSYEDFLQTDAAINPGNSGGALVDLDGQLIGINTAILTSQGQQGGNQGIGLAIPANLARRISAELLKSGKVTRGWIGLQVEPITDDVARQMGLPDTSGVLVKGVYTNGPAGQLPWDDRRVDAMLKINGAPIESPGQLRNTIADLPPGKKASISLWQNGKINDYEITLAPRPARVQGI